MCAQASDEQYYFVVENFDLVLYLLKMVTADSGPLGMETFGYEASDALAIIAKGGRDA